MLLWREPVPLKFNQSILHFMPVRFDATEAEVWIFQAAVNYLLPAAHADFVCLKHVSFQVSGHDLRGW